jgi:hypothetical protein
MSHSTLAAAVAAWRGSRHGLTRLERALHEDRSGRVGRVGVGVGGACGVPRVPPNQRLNEALRLGMRRATGRVEGIEDISFNDMFGGR